MWDNDDSFHTLWLLGHPNTWLQLILLSYLGQDVGIAMTLLGFLTLPYFYFFTHHHLQHKWQVKRRIYQTKTSWAGAGVLVQAETVRLPIQSGLGLMDSQLKKWLNFLEIDKHISDLMKLRTKKLQNKTFLKHSWHTLETCLKQPSILLRQPFQHIWSTLDTPLQLPQRINIGDRFNTIIIILS